MLLVGLDAAGKTTILYRLKLGEIVTTLTTIGEFTTLQNDAMREWLYFVAELIIWTSKINLAVKY